MGTIEQPALGVRTVDDDDEMTAFCDCFDMCSSTVEDLLHAYSLRRNELLDTVCLMQPVETSRPAVWCIKSVTCKNG